MRLYQAFHKIKTEVRESEKEHCSKEDMDRMKLMAKQIARRKATKKRGLQKVAVAAMAVVLAGGITVGAAVSNGWNGKLTSYFNRTMTGDKVTEKISDMEGSDQVLAEDSDKGIKVKVIQSSSVKGMMYVLVKVELPIWKTFTKDQLIKNFLIQTGANDDPKKMQRYDWGYDSVQLVQREKNVGWFVCRAERKGYDFDNKKITIQLKGFTNTHTTPADLIFENPKGAWKLQWTAKENDSDMKTVAVNQSYPFEDTEDELSEKPKPIMIHRIEVTPFYMKVYYGKKGSNKMENLSRNIVLKLKDGTIQKETWSYGSPDPAKGEYRYEHADFKKIIDLQQLETVIIGSHEIPVNK